MSKDIKVGDRVRIKDNYPWLKDYEDDGTEFEVTAIKYHKLETSNFHVAGDALGRGIWEQYIEKVDEPKRNAVEAGDYVRVVIEGKVHDAEGDFLYVGPNGESEIYKPDALVEKIDPPEPPLLTEPGLYVSAADSAVLPDLYALGNYGGWMTDRYGDWKCIDPDDLPDDLVPLVKAK